MEYINKLQDKLHKIMDPEINFHFHCLETENSNIKLRDPSIKFNNVYKKYKSGNSYIPARKYIITINDEIIWNYPGNFDEQSDLNCSSWMEIKVIPSLLQDYIDSTEEELLHKKFSYDRWGLTDILKTYDKRLARYREKILQTPVL